MKITHISYSDNRGGSAKSALKIHRGLQNLGVDSKMYVNEKNLTCDKSIKTINLLKWQCWVDKKIGEVERRVGYPDIFYPFSRFFYLRKYVRNSDIVQIYNIHGGYFEYKILKKIATKSVLVWRLSDMWSMTGHCAYAFNCDKWKTGCEKCPDLRTYPWVGKDRCHWTWKRKQKIFQEIENLCIVAPSKWIAECVSNSPILKNKRSVYIPNGIDCNTYSPRIKAEARLELGLDVKKKIVLFLSANLEDERKGLKYLLKALMKIDSQDIDVVCVGESKAWHPVNYINLGEIDDANKMAEVYSAADVYVLPTLADNLPNTVLESMACGTPVVAFDVGGISDAVKHMETGYLVQSGNTEELAEGIQKILENEELAKTMGSNGRNLVLENFTCELQAQSFYNLYNELI